MRILPSSRFDAGGEEQVLLLGHEARGLGLAEIDGDAALDPVAGQELELRRLDVGSALGLGAAGGVGVELGLREDQAAGAGLGAGGAVSGRVGAGLAASASILSRAAKIAGRLGPDLGRHSGGGGARGRGEDRDGGEDRRQGESF